MAKKSRRVNRARSKSDVLAPKAAVKTPAEPPPLSAEEQLRQEYAYVLKDLRWIFSLAAIMFALLIVLNLVL